MADTTWKEAILRTVADAPESPDSLRAIYSTMERHPLVTPDHLHPWRPGGQPRFRCWIRRYLTTLVREGELERAGKEVIIERSGNEARLRSPGETTLFLACGGKPGRVAVNRERNRAFGFDSGQGGIHLSPSAGESAISL